MSVKYAVTGIGTDVGKTVVSAILAEALRANYWKPVQAGDLDNSDSIKVSKLTTNVRILPEGFKLSEPMSPHAAAEIDGVEIQLSDLALPNIDGPLIAEGAGGLMVPINSRGLTYADVFQSWDIPVIVVSRHYLGSINHTLLTVEVLKQRNIKIEGIVFVGDENKATESIILDTTKLKMITRVPIAKDLNKDFIAEQAKQPQIQYNFI